MLRALGWVTFVRMMCQTPFHLTASQHHRFTHFTKRYTMYVPVLSTVFYKNENIAIELATMFTVQYSTYKIVVTYQV